MKIGYCPTMESFVYNISKEKEFNVINLGSAGAVFMALNQGRIDVGIVGRTAKMREFSGYKKRIGEGYTLITNKKQMILNDDLPIIKINTALPEALVKGRFSYLKNVVYHKTINNELSDGKVWLISWDDWKDNFELLIPVDEQYNKNPDFRVPHIFSKKEEYITEIMSFINMTS